MTDLAQLVFSGLATGSIYGLAALGIVAIYSVSHIVNLAQGEFVALAGLLGFSAMGMGLPWWAAIAVSILVTVLVAVAAERFAIAPMRKLTVLMSLILTLGISTVLKAGMLLIWGPQAYQPPSFPGQNFAVGAVQIRSQEVWIVLVSLSVTAALVWAYEHTSYGKAMRACADQPIAARLVGISPRTATAIAFGIAGFVGAVGGVVGAPIYFASWESGLGLGLKGFVAATLGGLTSLRIAMLGGMMLGVLENLVASYGDSGYRDATAFVVLLMVLLLKPEGLSLRKAGVRV